MELLARLTFSIQYQKGRDNADADALSHVASKLNAEAMKSILDGVTVGTVVKADAHDPVVAEANEWIHKQVEETASQVRAAHMHVSLHVTDCVAVQQGDPILKTVMEWISSHKVQDLKHLLEHNAMMEDGMVILREQKKFMLHQGALYHHHTVARELEEAMCFVVSTAHRLVAINGCHRETGHQGQWQTLSLLQDKFLWPGMAMQMQRQSVAVKGVFSMKVPELRFHYKLSWSLLWSFFMWISPALKQLWNWTNHHT